MSKTPPATAQAFNVLIVDDDSVIDSALSEFLTLRGYRTRSAVSASDALAELRHHPCDLVITDIRMPRMNGLELVAVIRRLYPQTRVVVMTGHMETLTESNLQNLGIDKFLSKPFTLVELMRAVNQLSPHPVRSTTAGTTPIHIPTGR